MKEIETSVLIHAQPEVVWDYLTDPEKMKSWMGDPELAVEVLTDWKIGNPIVVKGFHHVQFENTGKVLQFDPPVILQYSHLSSVSQLPDTPENHTIFTFRLIANQSSTILHITAEQFATESIYHHLKLYWPVTAVVLKNCIESRIPT